MKRIAAWLSGLALATAMVFVPSPAQAYCDADSCSTIQRVKFYAPGNAYEPLYMKMNGVNYSGQGDSVSLTIGQASNAKGLRYVSAVYVPAGWNIECVRNDGSRFVKWASTGWHQWPGSNLQICGFVDDSYA